MSFFRRLSLGRSSRARAQASTCTSVSSVGTSTSEPESPSSLHPVRESQHSSFESINALAHVDSQLYIVVNFPAWDGCVVSYPNAETVARLMSKLQSTLSTWVISLEVKKVDHFFIRGNSSSTNTNDADITKFKPVMLVQVYHRPGVDGTDTTVSIYNHIQDYFDQDGKCSIEVWTDKYHQNS